MTDYDDILHDALEQITPACFNSSMRPLCWQLYMLCYYHPRTNELPIFQIYRFSARSNFNFTPKFIGEPRERMAVLSLYLCISVRRNRV